MHNRIKLVDIELSCPPKTIEGLEGYITLKGLIRLNGTPLGYIQLPVINDHCTVTDLIKAILEQHSWPIVRQLLCDLLATAPEPDRWRITDLPNVSHSKILPLVTVAVCTRYRPDDLALCLNALNNLDYPKLDLLVVDNAPSTNATERLVRTTYPNMRYVCEPRPGLDWARNRAIIEARGEIIAYTDDDVMVDSAWVSALAKIFAENPEVMAVTGLVVPYELETEAQILFEIYGGFGRGFQRKWYRLHREKRYRWGDLGTGELGTGANMAYRRSVFEQIGSFDPALDVGTVTNGGGDLEMFFRVLKEDHTLVYEPNAIVRHRHRRDYDRLRTQIANNGVGLVSYWVRTALTYPDERSAVLRIGLWWLWYWNIRRLLISFLRPARFPRDLILAELKGWFVGLARYQKSRRFAAQIVDNFDPIPQAACQISGTVAKHASPLRSLKIETAFVPQIAASEKPVAPKAAARPLNSTAVRTIELARPWQALTDVTDYNTVRVFVTWNDCPLGSVDIANDYQPLSATRLRETLVDHLGLKLLEPDRTVNRETLWAETLGILKQRYMPAEDGQEASVSTSLLADVSVSVVVATLDRPDDLRKCLQHLIAQESPRQVEIVVVDNNPASGLTPPIVEEFPDVVLVNEPRKGLAYARNAGFTASGGAIAIATDDDVVTPPDWLEKLVAPFARADVMVVTGNVLPLKLETPAQRYFEEYGGLGRGFDRYEVNGDWFESFQGRAVPTWELGATANAAFRTSIFKHPQIGLMDEALGPGMPSGVGEDTYLFYKVLKAGYTLVYEPTAYVWHKHRRDLAALRRQIYNYSKGHVAYHLTTLLRDHDWRALRRIAFFLPIWHMRQIMQRLRGRSSYPLSFIIIEILGNLAGPFALWKSRRRVKREGYSTPYSPVSQRLTA